MAFQKTKGRGVFVQPTGMPNLSGFSQAAAEYANIAKLGMSIGTNERQREFNDAIRQAEIEGKTSGVKRDADGNLVPLVNFEYAKAAEMYSDKERDAVLKAYKTAAIGAYTSQAVSGIYSAANESYLANPNDPDAIEASMQGYMSSLSKMDQDIYLKLAPKAEAAFLEVKNRAAAKQQAEAEETSRVFFGEHFQENVRQLGNLVAVGSSGEPSDDAAFAERFSELQEEQEQILENLATFGTNPTQIQALRDSQNNHLALRAGQAHVERIFTESGSYEKTLVVVQKIISEASSDVDPDMLRQSLNAHASNLYTIQQQAKKEEGENRENIFQSIQQQINKAYGVDGKQAVAEMLADLNHEIHTLKPTQIATLMSLDDADKKNYANKEYNEAFAFIDGWKTIKGTKFEENIADSFNRVKELYDLQLIGFDKMVAARESFLAYYDDKYLKDSRDELTAHVYRELSGQGTFLRDTEFFRSKIPLLQERGVIGEKSIYFKDVIDYERMLNSYGEMHTKRVGELWRGNQADRYAKQGIVISEAMQKDLLKVRPEYKAVVNGVPMPIDFFPTNSDGSINQEYFQASVDAVDRFSAEYRGLLHPEAKVIFESAHRTPEVADTANRILGQITTAFANRHNITVNEAMNEIFDVNDFTESDRAFLFTTMKLGPDLARQGYEGLRDLDVNRALNKFMATSAKGMKLEDAAEEFFQQSFTEGLTGHNWWKLFNPLISDVRQNQLIEFAESNGIGNVNRLKDAVIKDPNVSNALKGIFFQRFSEFRGEGNRAEVMRSAMQSLGKRFGYEENEATGEIYLVERPISHYAQASVPSMRLNNGQIVPTMYITERMIAQEAVSKFLNIGEPGLRDPKLDEVVRDVLNDRSGITFHANPNFGNSDQTYTVVVTSGLYGNPTVIHKEFKYDFQTSIHAPYWEEVESRLKTSWGKEFWSAFGLMDRGLIQSMMERYSARKNDYSLTDLTNKLNELRLTTSPGLSPEAVKRLGLGLGEPLTKDKIDDFFMILSQGFLGMGRY